MAGAGNHGELVGSGEPARRPSVELEHLPVLAADDQQGRSLDLPKSRAGKVGAAPAGNDRGDTFRRSGRRAERRGGTCRGAEETDRQIVDLRSLGDPSAGGKEPAREQVDVEYVGAVAGLASVSRSKSRVANPAAFRWAATALFRGLKRLEPLP